MTAYKDMTILMGGDLQTTSHNEDQRSYYPPLSDFCTNIHLDNITPKDTYIYIPAKTHLDRWLLTQPHTINYTTHNINIAT